eukprot:CAMPEP_0118903384 /NCGR_PEP_ID=MMETSP1166-20130328/8271_1 /TAXON_ID=1104430 /ORGANISM="Chrysoreinhardia sp, Strain CCMP3193" /LENGTH=277 /DNA_ID=CAMNT_0006842611 /DNA_START=111 /DNA_END=944 /DNA_ORIENTATION=-
MSRRRPRGVILDMDGTTLTSSQRLTERTAEAIRALNREGIEVIIATGRPSKSLQPFVDELGVGVTGICFNGAATLELVPGTEPKVLKTRPPTKAAAREVLACVTEHLGGTLIACHATASYAVGDARLLRAFQDLENLEQRRLETLNDPTILDGALKFVAVCGEDNVQETATKATRLLSQDTVRVVPAEIHVEFLNPTTNKGAALADLLGDMASQYVAMGDNINDIEMLQLVGCGIAMKNAKQATKQAADRVSLYTNDDDGVALEIEDLLSSTSRGTT